MSQVLGGELFKKEFKIYNETHHASRHEPILLIKLTEMVASYTHSRL